MLKTNIKIPCMESDLHGLTRHHLDWLQEKYPGRQQASRILCTSKGSAEAPVISTDHPGRAWLSQFTVNVRTQGLGVGHWEKQCWYIQASGSGRCISSTLPSGDCQSPCQVAAADWAFLAKRETQEAWENVLKQCKDTWIPAYRRQGQKKIKWTQF